MPLIVGNAAEALMLGNILNISPAQNLVIHLYSNDYIPTETSTIGNFTEVTGGGYSSQNLVAGSWVVTPGDPSSAEHPQISWIFTGAVGNIYGYYVTRSVGGELFWSERFTNGPYNIQNTNDTIRVTPRITLE